MIEISLTIVFTNFLLFGKQTQINTRDPGSPIPSRVMSSSAMGLNLGGLRVFAAHARKNRRKTDASTIFAPCGVLCGVFYLRHTHLTNRDYFDYGKPEYSQFEPCRDQDGAGTGISGVYLCNHTHFFGSNPYT